MEKLVKDNLEPLQFAYRKNGKIFTLFINPLGLIKYIVIVVIVTLGSFLATSDVGVPSAQL